MMQNNAMISPEIEIEFRLKLGTLEVNLGCSFAASMIVSLTKHGTKVSVFISDFSLPASCASQASTEVLHRFRGVRDTDASRALW